MIHAYDIILKKRNGGVLSRVEIDDLISGYMSNEVADYQMAAFCMAVFFRGMTSGETVDLTMALVRSGETIDLSQITGVKVDKHSTGGVGDKTTLVLGPLVAAAGVPVAKMSGRGLGFTGGTLDKLESIPGMRVDLTRKQFVDNVNRVGVAVTGQCADLVPADGKLYSLRDVTTTVESIPLIASSVMSKKIASGADGIVLDVKTGQGAFMKSLDSAVELARLMVDIGHSVGRRTIALITDMDQPLGMAVGNSLEVKEAILALQGKGPSDLVELCLALGGRMLAVAGTATDAIEGAKRLRRILASGAALGKFEQFVAAQGGDPRVVSQPDLLPQASRIVPVLARTAGYVNQIAAQNIGLACVHLGAGRRKKGDPIDPAVGVVLERKIGDPVSVGEPLAYLHTNAPDGSPEVTAMIHDAFVVSDTVGVPPISIRRTID